MSEKTDALEAAMHAAFHQHDSYGHRAFIKPALECVAALKQRIRELETMLTIERKDAKDERDRSTHF